MNKPQINMQQLSQEICIPRMENNISKDYIYQIFKKLDIGKIINIQETPLYNDTEFKKVMLRVKWNTQIPKISNIMDQLNNGKSIKLVHSEPWYWKIVLKR